ncbi:MAG: hypothetical protein M1830_010034 [Pleopsidium flavum]|nr:MAG: hypothetical protein M1830_010034 [Pleopsidium flavum]
MFSLHVSYPTVDRTDKYLHTFKANLDTTALIADKTPTKPTGISISRRKMTDTCAAIPIVPIDVSEYQNCIYFNGYRAIELAHERGLDHAVPDLNLLQVCKLYQLMFIAQYPWRLTRYIFLQIPHHGPEPSEEELKKIFFDKILSNEQLMRVFWEATAVKVDQATKEQLQHDIMDLYTFLEDRGYWEREAKHLEKPATEKKSPQIETSSKMESSASKVYILETHADPNWEGPEMETDTFLRWLDYGEGSQMLGYKSTFCYTPLLEEELKLDIRRFEAHIDMTSQASVRFGELTRAVEEGVIEIRELPPAPINRQRLHNGFRVNASFYSNNHVARLREAKWNEKNQGYCVTSRIVTPEWFKGDGKTEH